MSKETPIDLLQANRVWADGKTTEDPEFFSRLCGVQTPKFLWIGCSDSRVPANEIVDLQPGEMFVHRNIANVVSHGDLNVLSVLQYAVEVLEVRHVIVTGHYGCGGVHAAMSSASHGLIDNWLGHIRDVYREHFDELMEITDFTTRADRMVELNVAAQVRNVAATTIVQNAWHRGQPVEVHGWVYGLEDGKLRDLGVTHSAAAQLHKVHRIQHAGF